MKKYIALLVFLISSIAITGVSFIDGKIWDIIFYVVGIVSYAVVGILFSLGILSTKKQGSDAYAFVFLILILGGYGVYKLLELIRIWILSWPLFVKILVPSLITVCIGVAIFFVINKMITEKKNQKRSEDITKDE